nr:hypothetical protein BaRGS_002788 [Batillaria attramentaria]
MVIAVERCVCVVFPLRANSIMRTRTMGALLAAIFIVMHLGFFIIFFRERVENVYDERLGFKTHKVTLNEDFKKYDFILWGIVYTIIFSFLVPIVTFVVVGVATAITVIRLKTAIAWRASTSSGRGDNQNQQQQAALTKMLVILSCVFMEEPPSDAPDKFTPLEINSIVINCVLNPILLLVGVPANIISCLVFYKQGLRDRMNLCLFVLALVDTVVVNFSFLVFGMRATSGCITMVIAVERCVCVVFPLRANSIMRTRTMGALLAITFIIMHLGFSIMFFRNK